MKTLILAASHRAAAVIAGYAGVNINRDFKFAYSDRDMRGVYRTLVIVSPCVSENRNIDAGYRWHFIEHAEHCGNVIAHYDYRLPREKREYCISRNCVHDGVYTLFGVEGKLCDKHYREAKGLTTPEVRIVKPVT